MSMSLSSRLVALTMAGLVLVGFGAATPAAAYPPVEPDCTSGVPGDVNGDGYAEVAVSAPRGDGGRGTVSVFYGHPSGLVVDAVGKARNDQLIDQSWNYGIDREPIKGFGQSTAFGDVNGDGCADLIVGGGDAVSVVYGTPKGLAKSYSTRFRLGSLYAGLIYNLGTSLAVGDFDRDGIDDVAVGAVDQHLVGFLGAVVVLFGDRGLRLNGGRFPQVITSRSPGLPESSEDSDNFGHALAAGDFDGDGHDELAVAVPSGGPNYSGYVQVLRGGPQGFVGTQPAPVTLGRPDDGSTGFGQSLAAGDVNGDGRDDLAVGAPFEKVSGSDQAGAVYLGLGSPTGITPAGRQRLAQGVAGVPGTPLLNERFGTTLAIGRLDAGDRADLVVGTPDDYVSGVAAGSVTVLFGTSNGVGSAGARIVHLDTPGVTASPRSVDEFGAAIAVPLLQSRSQSSLVIGDPEQPVGKHVAAGAVYAVPIAPAGPDTARTKRITADTPGVRGTGTRGLRFGSAVLSSRLDS